MTQPLAPCVTITLMKSETVERFDRTAEGYLRWWAPVLSPASVKMIDRLSKLDPGLRGGRSAEILDLGCGTGNLLFEAARCWPGTRLTGLDASVGMLDVARREAAGLPQSAQERIRFELADAGALPEAAASCDLVMTAFVLQQVPDRGAVLNEIHRILRPGGALAIYGWIKETVPFAPEQELERALQENGVIRPPARDARSGHYRSVQSAAEELRAAGFRRVAARPDSLSAAWTAEDFIEYRRSTRDVDLFAAMDERTQTNVIGILRQRLAILKPDEMVHRPPVVSIVARKG
jgi:ubiquinone/menaquinone biosynthesis C-methylase UbiE